MVIWAGPDMTIPGEMPLSRAATTKNILNADPGWKPVPPWAVARSTWDFLKLLPPYRATIWPVPGSTLASAPAGSPRNWFI
jgi:hypothetical protein